MTKLNIPEAMATLANVSEWIELEWNGAPWMQIQEPTAEAKQHHTWMRETLQAVLAALVEERREVERLRAQWDDGVAELTKPEEVEALRRTRERVRIAATDARRKASAIRVPSKLADDLEAELSVLTRLLGEGTSPARSPRTTTTRRDDEDQQASERGPG